MLIGIVSDTHNNLKNIELIIDLFNNEDISLVIHTGDITNAQSLHKFSRLKCKLIGVYGNNDRNEVGLEEVALKNSFIFKEPPNILSLNGKNLAIFHEPEYIESFLLKNNNIEVSFSKFGLLTINNAALKQSIEIVRRRIDDLGTKEPTILQRGDKRILVELPGVRDHKRVKKLLQSTYLIPLVATSYFL